MKPIWCLFLFQIFSIQLVGQVNNMPFENPRAMAEWEELQAIIVVWEYETEGILDIMTQIVAAAKEEVEVIIVCEDIEDAIYDLENAGIDTQSNIRLIESDANSMWVRDYGPNTVYANDVDTLGMVDWIYNRADRPLDDIVPSVIAEALNVPLFSLAHCPERVVHTGGNFMSDGLGTAFSTNLVLEENSASSIFTTCPLSAADLDNYMNKYMGIDTYIKVEELHWDSIHHIDMHMKLLDEKTLLVGEYPEGVADGPQIEANLQYILSNFTTTAGESFEVIRIEMPPGGNGNYIDAPWWAGPGPNRTYTNALFVNKTILVPTYEPQYDEPALAIWEDAMPGYNIVGIECNDIIGAMGAIHCITKEVGVEKPLWITTNRVVEACESEPIDITACIKHAEGISNAAIFYRTDPNQPYDSTEMNIGIFGCDWFGTIPAQPAGQLQYYIKATASNGKTINRPMPAPVGYFEVDVLTLDECEVSVENSFNSIFEINPIFPNPASAITCIPVVSKQKIDAEIELIDMLGRTIETIFSGQIPEGASKYFFDAQQFTSGIYFIQIKTANGIQSQKLILK